jgi:PAS domain S-box-containing protein
VGNAAAARPALRERLGLVYLCAGLLVTAVYLLLPDWGRSIAYDSVGLSAAVASFAGVYVWRPAAARTWVLLGFGALLFVAGDVVFDVYDFVLDRPTPFPSIADGFYLAGYPLLAAGLLALIRRARISDRGALIDAAIAATGAALLVFLLLVDGAPLGSLLGAATSAAYPAWDVLLLALLAQMFFAGVRTTLSYKLLTASFVLLLVSDLAYAYLADRTAYAGAVRALDLGWLLSYVCWGAAALHPSIREIPVSRRKPERLSGGRVIALGVALAAPCVGAVYGQVVEGRANVVALAVGSTVIAALVLWRIGSLARGAEAYHAALAESEARFRALTEHGADVVTVVDESGRVRYRTPSAERVFGYQPGELRERSILELVHPEDILGVDRAMAAIVAGPDRSFPYNVRIRRKDGTWAHVEGVATSLLDDPDVRGIVLNSRDVTELHAKNEELRHAQKLEAVGRLAGGVAHDFNNLLTAITGYSNLILDGRAVNETVRRDVAEIAYAADRASTLTRQLLAFSRRQVLQLEIVDLNALVSRIARMLQRLIGEHIELAVDLRSSRPHVRADASQLEQVLVNLVVNARDAMPAGGTLAISTADEDDEVRLTVADTGIGIDEETQRHIFEPFFTTKEPGRGTGLGLATAYGIVAQSGGRISVESEPGDGTRFDVRLARVPIESTATAANGDSPHASGTETVLVVEDEDVVRRLVRRSLELHGYNVLDVAHPHHAIELCRVHDGPIDALVTDIVMPSLDGHALADRLAELRPSLRILYTSGYEQGDLSDETQCGAGFLAKPFTPESLAAKVRELLDAVPA